MHPPTSHGSRLAPRPMQRRAPRNIARSIMNSDDEFELPLTTTPANATSVSTAPKPSTASPEEPPAPKIRGAPPSPAIQPLKMQLLAALSSLDRGLAANVREHERLACGGLIAGLPSPSYTQSLSLSLSHTHTHSLSISLPQAREAKEVNQLASRLEQLAGPVELMFGPDGYSNGKSNGSGGTLEGTWRLVYTSGGWGLGRGLKRVPVSTRSCSFGFGTFSSSLPPSLLPSSNTLKRKSLTTTSCHPSWTSGLLAQASTLGAWEAGGPALPPRWYPPPWVRSIRG
jgi:hypothetical protein